MAISSSREGDDSLNRQAYAACHEVFPVALLLAGRPCLVVGGGKVGTRKVRGLLDAGAEVLVVAPAVSAELAELVAAGTVAWERRPFHDGDVTDKAVVFAATDDGVLNRHILELCRQTPALACAVDRHWSEGDFVTPATIREAGMCIAISSGGTACRRSRLMKETLARHLVMLEQADLVVMGTSHQQLSLAEREPYHLAGERLQATGAMLRQVSGLHEFCLLNTCNRVEVLAVASPETLESGILPKLLGLDALEPERYYVKRRYEAFLHSALVTSGLLSQTPGEKHVTAQLKGALRTATEAQWCGSLVGEWLEATLHVSKHIRQAFAARLAQTEIEDLCLDYLRARPLGLASQRVLVVGTGEVGRGLIDGLLNEGVRPVWCYHRHRPALSATLSTQVERIPWSRLPEGLARANVVVCATGGDEHVLGPDSASGFASDRPITIIDLGMPRNVDPELADALPNVDLIDLDDLKHWLRREDGVVADLIDRAAAITAEHRSSYERLLASLQGRHPLQ